MLTGQFTALGDASGDSATANFNLVTIVADPG